MPSLAQPCPTGTKETPYSPSIHLWFPQKHYILNAWVISRERMRELRWRKENIKKRWVMKGHWRLWKTKKSKMADETSNEELLKAVKRIKSPLFEFEFQTVGPLKCWKKNVVARQPFAAHLKEFCQPSQDDYDGAEITRLIMFQLPKLLCQSLSLLLPRRH